jgi:mannose PTS system EIID component
MIGGGFAFALLPHLRTLHRGHPERLEDGVQRHAEHFNAHPYLAPIALGAVVRMEEDGESPEDVRRFKMAVRGPLGSLGDSLVWAGWLPVTLLVGLVLAVLGAGPWLSVVAFLVLYNIGHLVLRIWGFRMGFSKGRLVSEGIRAADFARHVVRLSAVGALLLGLLAGQLLVAGPGTGRAPWPWLLASALTFLLGYQYGPRVRRAETYIFMLVISAFFLIGLIP